MAGLKTRRTAGEPELTLAVPSNTVHPLQMHGYGWASSVLQPSVEQGLHSTASKGVRTCRARCVGQG